MRPESSTTALLQGKCPRCHQGEVFTHSAFSFKFAKMHARCPHCGADFVNEPGFYYGAMFVSYAITVAIFVAVWLVLRVLIDPTLFVYMVSVIVVATLLAPLNFRLSRITWLYWFGGHRFDPSL